MKLDQASFAVTIGWLDIQRFAYIHKWIIDQTSDCEKKNPRNKYAEEVKTRSRY